MYHREREPTPDWPRSNMSLSETSMIADVLHKFGFTVDDPHIQHRHKDRYCFGIRCACGMRVDAEVDVLATEAAQRAKVEWITHVVVKAPLAHGNCARDAADRRKVSAIAPRQAKAAAATLDQVRSLGKDPFVRAAIAAFGPETNVTGAQFGDGATWRNWQDRQPPAAEEIALAERWKNSTYTDGPLPPAPRPNWDPKKKR